MHIITQFPHEIVEDPDMGVPMPDGCRLSARSWMPEDSTHNRVPAILEYIPYRKRDGTVSRDEIMHKYFAGRGYAVIRLDLRGQGESEGILHDEYTQTELDDACSAIAWIASQPWCNGNVGMMGKSWGGFNCLQVAAMAPPALKAIVTVCSSVDRYADDIHYKGGCLLNDNFLWGAGQMLSYSSRPPDPALVGDKWRSMWMERLETSHLLAARWLSHPTRDDYWKHGSICEDYSTIKASVLSFGGWADNYMNTVAHLVENIQAPVKGIVGPWVHQYPHQADPAPQIGFLQEAVRWWDHWLKGINTGVMDDPAYRVWLQDSARPARLRTERSGKWVAISSLPSERLQIKTLHFSKTGGLSDSGDCFSLTINSPMDCGFGTGSYFPMSGKVPQLSGDQRDDDARSLCFDSAALTEDAHIIGTPVVRLRLRSDQPVAQLVVRLCEVHPDGASNRITYGVLNLCHRTSHEHPEPLKVGKSYDIELKLDQIAARVVANMKLRVAISSAYWPFLWPTANKATLTILEGSIELPEYHGIDQPEWEFEEAEGAELWKHRNHRPALYEKKQTVDQTTGEVTLRVVNDEGMNEDLSHGLVFGSITRETFRIHPDDPLCASTETGWTQEIRRGNWHIQTETAAKMWSDADNFYLSARLEAYEGETLVFEHGFNERVERHFN